MAADNFENCFSFTVGVEGGLTLDREDRGNWTSGHVGIGELNGTKYGISAASYPKLDIRNLTMEKAKEIYRRDYWNRVQGDRLPRGLDLVAFDGAVNSGPGPSEEWIQEAVGAIPDGVIGPKTLAAIANHDLEETIKKSCENRLGAMKTFHGWGRYHNGWTNRIERLQTAALNMIQS